MLRSRRLLGGLDLTKQKAASLETAADDSAKKTVRTSARKPLRPRRTGGLDCELQYRPSNAKCCEAAAAMAEAAGGCRRN